MVSFTAGLPKGESGRVFNGRAFEEVFTNSEKYSDVDGDNLPSPVSPIVTGDSSKSSIFVSIPHFRDGKRCAKTLRNLFSRASHPDRIFVGLIEQTDAENPIDDPTCLEEYCSLLGFKMQDHKVGIAHKGEKQADHDALITSCPRANNQIRSIRFHYLFAKGPVYARSFIRKVLKDEEFCMEIDASTDFTEGWDVLALQQWLETGNEYAVLSTIPPPINERDRAESKKGTSPAEVPRQCAIKIGSEGVPLYEAHADGIAIGLTQPLLSRAHSSSFAFSKCHFEVNIPHDPFATQLLEAEKFPRFARMWTRGYDVYTPSINLVYRDNSHPYLLHHAAVAYTEEDKKWPQNDHERRDAHIRMKILLGIHHGITVGDSFPHGGGSSSAMKMSVLRANLGLYGLGRRRSLDQLLDFTQIALPTSEISGHHGNEGKGCTNLLWVPYDASISPRANLFDGTGQADNLDFDPEFPLRSVPDAIDYQFDHSFETEDFSWQSSERSTSQTASSMHRTSNLTIFFLWAGGVFLWCLTFLRKSSNETHVLTTFPRDNTGPREMNQEKATSTTCPERALKNV